MRLVSLAMLNPEMVLAKSIYYNDCLILKQGQADINRFAGRLSNMGINYVYIEDSKSAGIEIPDAISEETRSTCKHIVRQILNDFTNNNPVDISALSESISLILDDILENTDILVNFTDIGAADEYTYTHSISTTVYSLLIAKNLKAYKELAK
jgi:HD-GYP domain-containing protein (c-di-GMP phosphodiesterase class II)